MTAKSIAELKREALAGLACRLARSSRIAA